MVRVKAAGPESADWTEQSLCPSRIFLEGNENSPFSLGPTRVPLLVRETGDQIIGSSVRCLDSLRAPTMMYFSFCLQYTRVP